ncbi:MAG TPA: barstar family protein [Pyrinomonadaceae bacterium]|nr:barstar family protein [Pyrinomonadaceae bacterium]
MALVRIDANAIKDGASFHSVCKEAFGFPLVYGANMDAFVDCLTYIYEGNGMSEIILADAEDLTIEVIGGNDLRLRLPEIAESLSCAVEDLNERFVDEGGEPRIILRWL